MQLKKAIARFLDDRRRRGCNAQTCETYAKQLKLLNEYLECRRVSCAENVTARQLEDYLADLRARPNRKWAGTLSPVTVRKRAITLRTFFHFLKRSRIIRVDPAARLHIPTSGKRKPKSLAPEQVCRLLDRARWKDDGKVDRDYALLLLMLDSGLRLAELTALDVPDLDLERGLVHVRHGKGDKERWSVFLAVTAMALRQIAPNQGALFVNDGGQRLSALAIYRIVKRRARQAGVPGVSPHRLRHTWLTEYLNAGGKLHVAQMLAGHESIQTTIQYASVALAPVAREHQRYSPLRGLLFRQSRNDRAR